MPFALIRAIEAGGLMHWQLMHRLNLNGDELKI
jgi:hypothetical protein